MAEETAKKKRKRGRPKFEPSQDMRNGIRGMAGLRMPLEDIAKWAGIQEAQLRKHFKDELRMGPIEANAQIAQSLFDKAISNQPGAISAATLLANIWLGWKPEKDSVVPTANVNDQGTSPDGTTKPTEKLVIEFVKPPKWEDDVLDTPQEPKKIA